MASKDDQTQEKEPEKGKSKLKLILIISAAVILAVGGTAAFFLFTQGGHEKKEAAKTEKEGAPVIFELEPFIVNIYDGQELRYLRVKVEMEVSGGEEGKAEMTARKAQMRDTILVLLSAKTLLDVRDQQGKNQLRQEIFSALSKILPAGKVQKVYFTDFVVQ
ncbi:MAG TPA: flagellar basal body-associated FliL family protein [Geobacteraceae bacterium]|jgi:flagellar FliL protein|nr:flagellar basal body-associated FliL family protein [Geobacteraceae bacterium]